QSVDRLHLKADSLTMARLRSAEESLDRALSADTASKRLELCARARDLFQESKNYFLELWKADSVWTEPTLPIQTLVEMQSRYVACLLGEAQAEFVSGDMGA